MQILCFPNSIRILIQISSFLWLDKHPLSFNLFLCNVYAFYCWTVVLAMMKLHQGMFEGRFNLDTISNFSLNFKIPLKIG